MLGLNSIILLIFKYSGKIGNDLTNITRGTDRTSHTTGTIVYFTPVIESTLSQQLLNNEIANLSITNSDDFLGSGIVKIGDEFIKFMYVIEQSKLSLNQIKNLYFFPSKRWDLELKNNIILKLAKDHTKLSINQAFEIINNNNFNNIKVVDARIKNQIILND